MGGGNASFTSVYAPVPDDILRKTGAISLWQYFDGIYDGENYLYTFKTALGGSDLGSGTTNDIFAACIDRDTVTDNLSLVVRVKSTAGTTPSPIYFSLGRTAVELEGKWSHFIIQWKEGV